MHAQPSKLIKTALAFKGQIKIHNDLLFLMFDKPFKFFFLGFLYH